MKYMIYEFHFCTAPLTYAPFIIFMSFGLISSRHSKSCLPPANKQAKVTVFSIGSQYSLKEINLKSLSRY